MQQDNEEVTLATSYGSSIKLKHMKILNTKLSKILFYSSDSVGQPYNPIINEG
jgi:hypothetical protein